jgi:hypothetical protein
MSPRIIPIYPTIYLAKKISLMIEIDFDPFSSPSINCCCTRVVIQVLVGYITMKRFIGKYELGTVS